MKKEMLINVLQPEECRIAIIEDGTLEELYVERTSQESYVGNIYKGKIVNIEPSIQAAFVDFGIGRNGFLHVSDVDPAYYRHLMPSHQRGGGRGVGPRHREEFDERPRGGPRDHAPRDRDETDDARSRRERPAPVPPRERSYEQDLYDDAPRSGRRRPRREPEPREAAPPVERPEPIVHEAAPESAGGFGAGLLDDPYAGLVAEFGAQTEGNDSAELDAAEDKPRGRRGKSGGRGRRAPEHSPTPVAFEAPPPPPPPVQLPPPLPKPAAKNEESSFGAGLWDDDPPAFMPGAERRTFEDDDDFEGNGSGGGVDQAERDDDEPHGEKFSNGRRGPFRRGGPRRLGRDGDGHEKPLIQNIFKRGQEVLVQVIKEGIGTKGPTLSTYISIAGRYLVLMPGLNRIGVSRKIPDLDQRHRLRDIMNELNPPSGVGFIVRTAGVDRNKKDLQNDLAYLLRIWQVVVKRIKSQKSPSAIYQESDMITRTIRDTFTSDIDGIWIDENLAYQHAHEFLQAVMPKFANRLRLYDETEPLFHKYGLDDEIVRIQQKKVPLGGGGSIVIEQTEALVAIDVNSGNFRSDSQNAEETAFQMNLNAAKEIARQLRLRDLGGVIVNDFIDMKDEKHRRGVEKAMREAVKRDRARTKVLRISQFGLIEMTRQRIRPSLKRSVFQECTHCHGNGHVKTAESMSIEVMRLIQLAACREHIRRIDVRVQTDVADYLTNRRRREIAQLEDTGAMQVIVTGLRDVSPERLDFLCFDANNNEVALNPTGFAQQQRQPSHKPRRSH